MGRPSEAAGYSDTTIPRVLEAMERTPAWLARRMGVHEAHVSRVLRGQRTITRRFVARACQALALPEEALFVRPSIHPSMDVMLDRNTPEVA